MNRLLLSIALLLSTLRVDAMTAAPDTMAERAKPCLACHTPAGRSGKDAYYPRLAGKPAGYLFNQMVHFRDGRRAHRAMSLLLVNLSDDYLRALAEYFSLQQPVYPAPSATAPVNVPALVTAGDAARKIPPCTACHGETLMGVAPDIPGTAGLPRDYIVAQFGAWRVGTRKATTPDCMSDIARQLTEAEIGQIADWLATRAVPADAHAAPSLARDMPMRCGSVAVSPVAGGVR
jgi:cytochrome c553